jgi:heterodisulfide reductase subunit C
VEPKMAELSSRAAMVESLAHTRIRECYQCGKCTAGCPMSARMDVMPNQLIRLLQLEQGEKAMQAEAAWVCVSCQTCSARCPKSVDCAAIMDGLRQLSLESGMSSPAQKRTVIFQQAFLDTIRRNGRLAELELIGVFKTKAFLSDGSIPHMLKDALLAPQLSKRGKLHLLGERVRDRKVVERIFSRCMNR